MRSVLVLSCLLAALLSGCAGLDTLKEAYEGLGDYFGGRDNAEPPKELQEQEFAHKLTIRWKESVGAGLDEQEVNLVPAVTEAAVYAADRRGLLRAYNRFNGDKLWETDSELAFSAGPSFDRSKLVLGTSNAEVAAYNSGDGSLLWKTTVSSEVLAQPRIAEGRVVVRSSDGRITALDEKTGATQWTFERAAPILAVRSRGAPLVVEGLVLDGYGGGKLSALQITDGKPAWEATVAIPHGRSEIERLVDLDSNPAVRGSTLYVSGYQAGTAAVSLSDGEVQWRAEKVSSHTGLVLHRRTLFLTDAASDVWQIDSRDGGDLWKQSDLHQRRLTAPAVVKNMLVVGDFEGYLHLLSQDDGSRIEAAPVVFEDVIYVYTGAGTLAAVTLD